MIKKYIPLLMALGAFAIPIYLYYTPPTDRDGGPMLAYNLLFFLPLAFLSTIISTITLVTAFKSFRKRKIFASLLVLATIPTFYLLTQLVFHFYMNSKPNLDYGKPIELKNRTETITINKDLRLVLTGYTHKEDRKKITFFPEGLDANNYTANNFVQGEFSDFFLYYKVNNDSIYIYVPEGVLLYHTNDGLKKLPIKTIDISKDNKDTLIQMAIKNDIHEFHWK